jgi:hypothetical protein
MHTWQNGNDTKESNEGKRLIFNSTNVMFDRPDFHFQGDIINGTLPDDETLPITLVLSAVILVKRTISLIHFFSLRILNPIRIKKSLFLCKYLGFSASINRKIWHLWCQNGDKKSPGNQGVF